MKQAYAAILRSASKLPLPKMARGANLSLPNRSSDIGVAFSSSAGPAAVLFRRNFITTPPNLTPKKHRAFPSVGFAT